MREDIDGDQDWNYSVHMPVNESNSEERPPLFDEQGDILQEDEARVDGADRQITVPLGLGSGSGIPNRFLSRSADKRATSVGVFSLGSRAYIIKLSSLRKKIPAIIAARVAVLPDDRGLAVQELQTHLSQIIGRDSSVELWTSLQSPQTVIQTIRVPRVRESNLATVAFWTLKKERDLSLEDTVFDVERLREVEESGNPLLEVQAVAAPKSELKQCIEMYTEVGYGLTGVTTSVFAFRNLLRFAWPEQIKRQCVVLFINETSFDILIFSEGIPIGTRSSRSGTAGMAEAICQRLDIDEQDPRLDLALSVLKGKVEHADVGTDSPLDLETVLGWVRPALRRLVRSIELTLHAFEGQLASEKEVKFLVAGVIADFPPVLAFISQQLGVRLETVTPGNDAVIENSLAVGESAPGIDHTGMSFALGLALSGVYDTANLLFTFKDRQDLQQWQMRVRVSRIASFTVLASLICSLAVTRFYVLVKERERDQFTKVSGSEWVSIGREQAETVLKQAEEKQKSIQRMAAAYRAPAVVAEVSAITPPTVRITTLKITFQDDAGQGAMGRDLISAIGKTSAARKTVKVIKGEDPERDVPDAGEVILEGVISGRFNEVESELAQYVLALQKSAIFLQPVVESRRLEPIQTRYLRFGKPGSDYLLFFVTKMRIRRA